MKTDRFSEMGMASLLPGMRYMLDQMREQVNYLEQVLAAHQETREEGLRQVAREVSAEFGFDVPKRRGPGRPPGRQSQWAKMTAAERSAEMKRRFEVRDARRAAGLGPIRPAPQGVSWAGMTAEQRSVEMKRRQVVAQQKRLAAAGGERRGRAGADHPRDPRHPKHAEWLAKISKANKKKWASMSAADRKKRIGAMLAHRPKKEALVNGAAQ